MGDQFWTTLRPVRKVGKLRGVIEIPAFSAPCGNRSSLEIYPSSVVSLGNTQFTPTSAYTIKFWFKPLNLGIGATMADRGVILGNDAIDISVYNARFRVVNTTSADTTLDSNITLIIGQWYHVAITFDVADDICKIYINGFLDNTVDLVGVGNLIASSVTYISQAGIIITSALSAYGYISDLECWTIIQSAKDIYENLYVLPYGPGAVGLKFLFNMREASGSTIKNLVTGTTYSLTALSDPAADWVNDFPSNHLYNTSFICGLFTVDCDEDFSLKFPIPNIDDYNFVLCVIGVDGIRYKLWSNDAFRISHVPPDYRGQRLPSDCQIEVWSLDGEEIALLSAALNLETSLLGVVTDCNDVTPNVNSAPVIDTTLEAPFPWTFPVTFDTQQTYP